MMVIAALLVGACFAGCSMSQGSNSLLGNESSKESESYAEHLENNNISVAGNLGTAESVKVDKITSKKEIYSKVRSLVYNDKVVYIELCYINLYDKSGNKVQQDGEVSFQVKMSDTMTNAGGDTYDLYYYDSSDNKITAIDSEVDGNTISFKSDRIGFFVIVNVNNSGKPIVKPSEPVDEPSEETSGGSENKTDHSGEQPTTPAAVEPVVPATTPASQPSVHFRPHRRAAFGLHGGIRHEGGDFLPPGSSIHQEPAVRHPPPQSRGGKASRRADLQLRHQRH